MSRTRLPPSALQQQLQRLNAGATTAWTIEHDKLHKTFVFKNFVQAFGFMAQVALEAEKIDHHPDWCNVYKTVVVDLHTHDAGGITALDFTLAAQIDKLA